ncbi:cyanobactin class RiPP [Moorena sp. SIOASIH]|uniref:cyanobactin class RiPP n=1 Tax=Moorena sp. SIOASIH TaxID=2607817 RepID=UPI00344C44DD
MGKKKLLPGQKSPIVRSTTAKPIPGLEETALTEGGLGSGSITPSEFMSCRCAADVCAPFAGDGDE